MFKTKIGVLSQTLSSLFCYSWCHKIMAENHHHFLKNLVIYLKRMGNIRTSQLIQETMIGSIYDYLLQFPKLLDRTAKTNLLVCAQKLYQESHFIVGALIVFQILHFMLQCHSSTMFNIKIKTRQFNSYPNSLLFGCPMANFGPLSRGQPHSPDVNHCVLHFRPEGHREPRNEVGSLSPAKRLLGFEPGTFQFLVQCLDPLDHSPQRPLGHSPDLKAGVFVIEASIKKISCTVDTYCYEQARTCIYQSQAFTL